MIFIIFLGFCRTFHPTIWHYGILPENSLKVKRSNFLYFAWGAILTTEDIFCSLKSNCNHKVLIMEVTSKLIQMLSSNNQRNKLTNWVTMFWNFTYKIHCFCCLYYWISKQTAKNVLLSAIGNPLRIKINLSQIMTFSIKREKVCVVCPYLLFNRILRTLNEICYILMNEREGDNIWRNDG